ncbi:hypothetical protein A6035_14170 [Dietzia lutea]|uniref:Uncharacterized protein n=1 Tax=Dietzia lutea TaxID=546160 RepID=A0A2S1RA05_9ACTN|nr:hypothetical protein A6035_14170 [Dietzia lutea]
MGNTAAAAAGETAAAVAQGPLGAVVLAFEQVAVTAEAARVREAGRELAEGAVSLSAALEEASVVAAAAQAGGAGGLLTGGALAECAALLARRARDLEEETERSADGMARAAGLLAAADEEVAGRVAGAGP